VHRRLRRVLKRNGHLRVIDAREVARTGRLVLFRSKGEGVAVDTRVRGAGVVHVRHDLVVELAVLRLGTILAIEHKLEFGERTVRTGRTFLNPALTGATGTDGVERGTDLFDRDKGIGGRDGGRVGREDDGIVVGVGGEVPRGRVGDGTVVEAPDQFLDRVIVAKPDLLGTVLRHGVGTGVLRLLDEVLVRLLGEATAFFGVKINVVTPHLESRPVSVSGELRREVEVKADLVVLQGNKRKRQARVAVEEEDQRQIDGVTVTGRHLTPSRLLGGVEVQLRVQTPPLLVALVNALAADGKFDVLDRALGGPRRAQARNRGGVEVGGNHLHIHVRDQVTVARNSDTDATIVGRRTVDGLLDDLHGEVGVSSIDRVEKSHLRRRRQVRVLSSVGYELHETASHVDVLLYYTQRKKFHLRFAHR